jgi:hypothetical protein
MHTLPKVVSWSLLVHLSTTCRPPKGPLAYDLCLGGVANSAPGGRMSGELVNGFVVGGILGGWLGYHIGAWKAAFRAARSTYRTQRGLRR